MKIQQIKPDPECPFCHGDGEVYDYGSITALMPSWCKCAESQADNSDDPKLQAVLKRLKEKE